MLLYGYKFKFVNKGVVEIKELRRIIIVICLFILTLWGVASIPKGKYYDKKVKEMVTKNEAEVIEVGKKMKLDKDIFEINRIINTKNETYIRYTVIKHELGGDYFIGEIKVYDDKGQEYENKGGFSSSMLWGGEGLFIVNKIPENTEHIIVKLECYDRKSEMEIPLLKEGAANEE